MAAVTKRTPKDYDMNITALLDAKLVVLLEWISHGGQVCSEGFASSFRKNWKCDWLRCGDAAG
jgi:hypothetical protein